jgi:hypothetical protein
MIYVNYPTSHDTLYRQFSNASFLWQIQSTSSINDALLITLALAGSRLIADLDRLGQFLIGHASQIATHLLQDLLLIREEVEVVAKLLRCLLVLQ